MMSDCMALLIGYSAHRMALQNNSSNQDNANATHPSLVYMRYEIVGALINGTILLTSCAIMAIEAVQRILFHHERIENVDFVLLVGALGLFVNVVGIFIFGHHGHSHSHSHSDHDSHEHSHEQQHPSHDDHHTNLNVHGVFLHILGDLLGSVAVMISALIIKYTNGWWTLYVDPVCTLCIASLICRSAWPLLKQSADILLDKAPFNPDVVDEIKQQLSNISGVLNVHELHCWQIKPLYYMATVHLIVDPRWNDHDHTDAYCANQCDLTHDKMTIMDHAKLILHKFGIHSSNVQLEFPNVHKDEQWNKANPWPCFDVVCDATDCIPKSLSLANAAQPVAQDNEDS